MPATAQTAVTSRAAVSSAAADTAPADPEQHKPATSLQDVYAGSVTDASAQPLPQTPSAAARLRALTSQSDEVTPTRGAGVTELAVGGEALNLALAHTESERTKPPEFSDIDDIAAECDELDDIDDMEGVEDSEGYDDHRRLHIHPAVKTAALLSLFVFAVLGFALGGGFTGGRHVLSPQAAAGPSDSSSAPLDCVEDARQGFYRGRGVGDVSTQVGVIAAFEHAYYELRDAEAVVALTTPESAISATRVHTEGIALLPAEMSYCVTVTAINATTHSVELVERHPGGADVVINQEVDVIPYGQEFRIAQVRAR